MRAEHPSKSKLDPKDGAKGMANRHTHTHTHKNCVTSINLHTSHKQTYVWKANSMLVCSKYTLRNAKKGNNKKFF